VRTGGIIMGFMDKVKTAAKNADTKIGNSIDKEKLQSQVRSEERTIEETTAEIGKKVVEAIKAGKTAADADISGLMDKISESEKKIANLKEKIDNIGKESDICEEKKE